MNDTKTENGLVPMRIVFGITPQFPIINTDLPSQKVRLEAIKTVQADPYTIVSERRTRNALNHEIP